MHEKIKFIKYRNRKLHRVGDVNQYVTMGELLEIVAGGADIVVVDDQTGEDITAFTMARLVYDRSRMDRDAYKVKDLQKILMSNPPPKGSKNDGEKAA